MIAGLQEWLFCGGGLVSLVLCAQFAFHWVVAPLIRGQVASVVSRRDALRTVSRIELHNTLCSSQKIKFQTDINFSYFQALIITGTVVAQVVASEVYCGQSRIGGSAEEEPNEEGHTFL